MNLNESTIRSARRFKDNTLIISPENTKTLMGSNTLNYQGRFYQDMISETFLLNYRVNNNTPELVNSLGIYASNDSIASMRLSNLEENSRNTIILPKPGKLKGSLTSALMGRKSVRDFQPRDMDMRTLSDLLYYALGVKGEGEPTRIYPRSYPSGGGFYPVYLYFRAERIQGLEKGYYRYQPYAHRLEFIQALHVKKDELVNLTGINQDSLSFIGFWIYERRRNALKYGDLGLALAFQEMGYAAQTVQLVGFNLGIGFCALGGVFKQAVERELGIDGLDTHVIGCFVAGFDI